MCVRAVLGQQITVKAATTLSGRIAKQFGTPLKTGIPGLSYVFPSAQEVLQWEGTPESNLGPLGVIAARARTIWALAQAFQEQELSLFSCPQPEKEIKKLLALPGVGPWTAQYIAMRALGWTDAFPDTDLGVKKALAPRNTQQIRALAESWSPWRAYAVMCLWNWES